MHTATIESQTANAKTRPGEKPKNPSLTRNLGNYTVAVDAKRTRLPIEKEIFQDGKFVGTRTCFIPMTQVSVALMHNKGGDVVTFRMTAMGRKVGITRSTTMARALAVNKLATGPDMIETGALKESYTMERAIASVARMTGISLKDAAMLFDFDTVSALV